MSNVTFKRSPNVNSIPIVDGQLIFDETNNKIYMDNGEQRLQYGGDVSLISQVDYATENNAFSALATTELFLNKNTVVDSKTDALAATEQGLPVGCLAFQSAIGQADYSSIDNTISACLLTLDGRFKANNNTLYMDYHDGKYGVNTSSTRGADTFIPFNQGGTIRIQGVCNIGGSYGIPYARFEGGQASVDMTIKVDAYGVTILSQSFTGYGTAGTWEDPPRTTTGYGSGTLTATLIEKTTVEEG